MEPGKDYVLIRDGEEPTDRELAVLTGISSELFSWVESPVGSGSVWIRIYWALMVPDRDPVAIKLKKIN